LLYGELGATVTDWETYNQDTDFSIIFSGGRQNWLDSVGTLGVNAPEFLKIARYNNDLLIEFMTSGDNSIYDSSGDETMYAGLGDDRVWWSAGNDFIDGGAGYDTLKIYEKRADFEIIDLGSDSLRLVNNSSGYIIETDNIEEFHFYDWDWSGDPIYESTVAQDEGTLISQENFTLDDLFAAPGFSISRISRSGDEVVFGLYVDPTQDPGRDGIGSFDLIFDYDPSVLSIDKSAITYTQVDGFVGQTGAHNTVAGEIEIGGFSLPALTDFSSPMIEITATVLDSSQSLALRVTSTLFDDQSVPDTEATFEFGSRELFGTVTSRGGGLISDVTITGDVAGTDTNLSTTSSDQGSFILEAEDGIDLTVIGDLDYVNARPTKAITAQDALDALRLAVGLDTTSGSKDAFSYIAADFNQSGKVTAQDALEILKYAVGLEGQDAEWKFFDSDGDYSGISRSNTTFDEGITAQNIATNLDMSMTGILLGDVNDTYTSYLDIA